MVAITGMGMCCAAGKTTEESWQTLSRQQTVCRTSAVDFFTPHGSSPLFTVQEDNVLDLLDRDFSARLVQNHLPGINKTTALALKAAAEAFHQAGLVVEELRSLRVGIAIGTTVGCTFHNEPYYIQWKNSQVDDIAPVLTYLGANLSERLQSLLDVHGPRAVVTNACASGTDAIGLAKNWIEQDLCDIAIAGGTDEISRIACHGFSSLMLFSQSPCKPFDRNRSGLNLGEGAGLLVMESAGHAKSRNASILGRVLGYGAASDAYHPTAPHPQGRGLQRALGSALKQAGLQIQDICCINAHGTGTAANDLAELTALSQMGITPDSVPVISSTKGATGHTLGAAGGIEAVLTLQALRQGCVFGTVGCIDQDPSLPLPVLAEGQTASLPGKIGISQSLAFGGGNAALILEGETP